VLLFVYRQIVLDRSELLTSPYIANCVLYYWILFFVNLKSASSSTSSHLIRRCHRFYVVILSRFIGFSVWTLFVFILSFQLFPYRIIYVYLIVSAHHCRHLLLSSSIHRRHRLPIIITAATDYLSFCFCPLHPVAVITRSLVAVASSWSSTLGSRCTRCPSLASPSVVDTVVSSPGAVSVSRSFTTLPATVCILQSVACYITLCTSAHSSSLNQSPSARRSSANVVNFSSSSSHFYIQPASCCCVH